MEPQAKVNRLLLATAGVVLLGGGLLVLAAGLNVYRRWAVTPPRDWPLTTPRDVLLTPTDRTALSGHGWWWPAVIAVLALTVLLALWWLLAQLRRHRPGGMTVGATPPTDGVELRDQALSDALAIEAGHLPGVQKAGARMAGRRPHPEARITLILTPDSAPGRLVRELYRGPVERARQTAGWEQLPTRTHLRVAHRRAHRVE